MFYTTEEAAIVCDFLNLYLDRASVDASVRERNAAFQLGAAAETLQPEDYWCWGFFILQELHKPFEKMFGSWLHSGLYMADT